MRNAADGQQELRQLELEHSSRCAAITGASTSTRDCQGVIVTVMAAARRRNDDEASGQSSDRGVNEG